MILYENLNVGLEMTGKVNVEYVKNLSIQAGFLNQEKFGF
jgi:hypothetical protein